MICMTADELARATGATLVAGDGSALFEGLDIDTRRVPAGGAFVAFAGERMDGNTLCAQALRDGARVVVMTAEATPDVIDAAHAAGGAVLRAADDDGERFMLEAARAWRDRNPQWVVVGVTGSVGKTTTKEMLAAGIGASVRVHATEGNFNNLLGVPLTLFRAPDDAQVLVVEMGMNHAGELERISRAAQPDVAVITNVGTSHIGNLGSREAIANAKAEVASGLREEKGTTPLSSGDADPGHARLVLTATDDYCDYIERRCGVPTLRVGGSVGAVVATDVALADDGCARFELAFADGQKLAGSLSLPGRAMVYDLLSAMGVVEALGLPRKEALAAIGAMRPARMRMEVRGGGSLPRVVDDTYNASPASMAAALDVLASLHCDGRRVAVLGQMGELGDESERLHAMVGAYAAAKGVDLLVLVGDDGARAMREAALTMGFSEDHLELFATAADAARVMAPVLSPDDVVLAKASRAVGLDRFVQEVLGA